MNNENAQQKFCIYCGTKLDFGARFCKECGKMVNIAPQNNMNQNKQSVIDDVIQQVQGVANDVRAAFGSVFGKSVFQTSTPHNTDRTESKATDNQEKATADQESQKYSSFDAKKSAHENNYETDYKTQRTQEFAGTIIKCPNCGELLKAFELYCSVCGYELRGSRGVESVRELSAMLSKATDAQKISIIQSFPIPNVKEDVFEFMIIASTNFKAELYLDSEGIDKKLFEAWRTKLEQSYGKALLLFKDDPDFPKMQKIYDDEAFEMEVARQKRNNKTNISNNGYEQTRIIVMPSEIRNGYSGKNFEVVAAMLQQAGFTNIKIVPLYDLTNSFLDRLISAKPNTVDEIKLNGKSLNSYYRRKFESNSQIIITYHSLR